jgi:hypothetical protein
LSNGAYTNIDVPEALGAMAGSTQATAISPSGDILGTYTDSAYVGHGFMLSNGAFSAIPDIPAPGSYTVPLGMNPQGDIVGVYLGDNGFQGFLLSHGTVSGISVPGSADTFAYGIDPKGNIVGYYVDSNFNFHGFLLRRN